MVFFIFIQVLIENYASKQSDADQTPHSVASDLGLPCLPMSHKKDARHIWVKMQLFCYLIRVPEIWEVDC